MLYKNDELYKLTAADHKFITQMFTKFPIRLTYPESRVRPSRSKHNRLPDKPNSISFPLHATVKTDTGTQSWRYCENRMIGTDGRIVWSPHNLVLRGTIMLQKEDVELIYWLIKFCPFLEGGQNFNGKVPKCVIEDLVGQAERKAQKEALIATMKALIYSDQVGLGEKKLRVVAKAYFIPEVDDLSYAQVKLAVEAMVNRDKINGIHKFLDLAEADQTLEIKANLQDAVDRDIITFMAQKRTWAWKTGQGLKNEPICVINPGNDPNEALYDYFIGDRKFAQELLLALKGKSVAVPEGAEVAGPEEG